MKIESTFYNALHEEFGLIITTSDPERLLRRFYAVRRTQPVFASLSFVRMQSEIWILKKGSLDAPTTP